MCWERKHELHHLRLKLSLTSHKLKAWPYEGKVGIKEFNLETNKTELHVFEQWCYLETVDYEADLTEAMHCKYNLQFDLDIYRLIGKALSSSRNVIQFNNKQSMNI